MEERKLRGILAQYKSLKEQAEFLLKKGWELDNHLTNIMVKIPYSERYSSEQDATNRIKKLHNEIKALIEHFNSSVYPTSKEIGLDLNTVSTDGKEASLHKIIIECDKIIGALEEEVFLLSAIEKNKFDDLKKESAEICEKLDVHFRKNIEEALTELEKGHFLASALITSRVIDYVINKIQGENIDDKIRVLIEYKTIEKDDEKTKEQIIKSNKKSRNYLTHRIDTFAEPSDALSLLGDCVTLLKIYAKYVVK